MHLGMPECHKPFWVTVTLTSDLVFKNYCVQSIYPILFVVETPILDGVSSWDGRVGHTILSHFDLYIDFWPHF